MLFHRVRLALLSLASCSFLGQQILVQTNLPAQAQAPTTSPLVAPGYWVARYYDLLPDADQACRHLSGGIPIRSVDLLEPVKLLYLDVYTQVFANCTWESGGAGLIQTSCPYEPPLYQYYVYIGGKTGICILSSLFEKPELAPFVQDAFAKGAPIELTPEFWEALKQATGTLPNQSPVRPLEESESSKNNTQEPEGINFSDPFQVGTNIPTKLPDLDNTKELIDFLAKIFNIGGAIPSGNVAEIGASTVNALPTNFQPISIGLGAAKTSGEVFSDSLEKISDAIGDANNEYLMENQPSNVELIPK